MMFPAPATPRWPPSSLPSAPGAAWRLQRTSPMPPPAWSSASSAPPRSLRKICSLTCSTVNRSLFLDLDGTLIVDKVYLADPAGVELIPGAINGLQRARSLGYKLFLFTNQSGIGRGLHTLDDTHRVNARMEE